MIGCVRPFEDGNKTISLKVTDKKLLKGHIKIWRKISCLMKIEFGKEHAFDNNDGKYKNKIIWRENKYKFL